MSDESGFFDLLPEERRPHGARYAIIPVPFDATSTWKKGAGQGPEAVRRASRQLERYDIETGCEPCAAGICEYDGPLELSDPETMVRSVEAASLACRRSGAIPVVVGGEHSVAIGAARAAVAACPDVTVLQFDAHADCRNEYHGSRYNHACVMARVAELCPVVQIGVRSVDAGELKAMDRRRVFYAERMRADARWSRRALDLIGPNVYITFDLDAFDPSIMPSTGTPEPGGMLWYETIGFLKTVITARRLVGFDVVELCPGPVHAADILAAKLIYKMMAYELLSGRQEGAGR